MVITLSLTTLVATIIAVGRVAAVAAQTTPSSPSSPIPPLNDTAFAHAVRAQFGSPVAAMSNISTDANCDPAQTNPAVFPLQAYNDTLLLFDGLCATIPGGTNAKSFLFSGSAGGIGAQSEDVTFVTSVTLYEDGGCQGANHTLPADAAAGGCFHSSDLGANTVYSARFAGEWVPTASLPGGGGR